MSTKRSTLAHRVTQALRCSRKWRTHAICYEPGWLLVPSVEVMYLPVSCSGRDDERPGQVWVSLRFLPFSAGFGFYFWHPKVQDEFEEGTE